MRSKELIKLDFANFGFKKMCYGMTFILSATEFYVWLNGIIEM